ncbi:transglutaminase family protein [Aestuariivivens sediminis]|uniref:transglutaminase family protein n=1 Tax=Aestuariivivens sediminis TaxID=2913557 RepID=UPI001F579CD6|nr:transglutaminase family protein [Aestuariivivens sediminis]
MPKFYIKHLTKYTYTDFVIDGANQIMLFPVENDYQKVLSQNITISNNPKIETYQDAFKNTIGTFMVIEPHNYLSISSDVEVETTERLYPEDSVPIDQQWNELKSIKHHTEFIDFLKYKTFDGTPEILDMIQSKNLNVLSPFKIIMEFCGYIYDHFKYIQGITAVDSKLDLVWKLKAGVCQDFTNILLQMVRMSGIPARYVSGYICPSDENTRGEGATHAWIEVFIPFYGWLGIDPTNNVIANQFHVKLSSGRDYHDCAPVKGVYKGNAKDELFVKVKVGTVKSTTENLVFPINKSDKTINSYRKNQEVIQQVQQQQ